MIDTHHVKLFDIACQFAVAKILVLFRDTCLVGDRSTDSSLWYQIYHSIDRGEMFGSSGPFKTVFEILPFNQSGLYVILEKIVQLVETWIYEVDPPNLDHPSNRHNHHQMMPSITTELQKEKVNGFLGFAIAMVIQKYDSNKRKADYIDDERKTAEIHEIGLYLRNMRILHKHAITDSNYMKNCYSCNDVMLNRGGLTLVSPHYFQFALELVEVLDEEISEQKIRERKGNSYILATKNINLQRSELQTKFENCAKTSLTCSEYVVKVDRISQAERDKIFVDILQKTTRSMFNCTLKTVRENTTGHYAKVSSKDTHREKLKHDIAKHQMKSDGVKAEKAIRVKRDGIVAKKK